jgi:hypothetical protein
MKRRLTKAQSRKLLQAALAKCRKVWGQPWTPTGDFYFPTEAMATIEAIITDIIERNK